MWFRLVVRTVGLLGGANCGQPYDYSDACLTCGAGAVPTGPLIAQLSNMGKKLLDRTAHDGHLVVTSDLADALLEAGIGGVEVRAVRRPHLAASDPGYRWLYVVPMWPRMAPTTVIATDDLCPQCQRTGYFDLGRELGQWHYASPPVASADFGYTWERFGYWRGKAWETGRRGVGGEGGVIVSSRARTVLQSQRVRHLEYVPLVFDENVAQRGDAADDVRDG